MGGAGDRRDLGPVRVVALTWPDIAPHVREAAGDPSNLARLRRGVLAHQFQAVRIVSTDGACDLYAVIGTHRREMVVEAAEGRGMRAAAPVLLGMARERRAPRIRFVTRRPGLRRILAAWQPSREASIFTVEVDHGR